MTITAPHAGHRVRDLPPPSPHAGHRVRDSLPLPSPQLQLEARASRSDRYPIHITRSPEETLVRLAPLVEARSVAIVTDEVVEALYAARLIRGLRGLGCDVLVHAVPAGEASKSLEQAVALWDWLAAGTLARRDVVLALGGGVIADLGGWVASAYMRGIAYVNLPTTLLAQVDGALGGKVAVNHPVAKNLLGAFHQPAAVISDVSCLRTLDRRHVAAGLAECIKKAVIASPDYWRLIRRDSEAILAREPAALERLVRGASAIKSALIERDPYEVDLRRPLNFGHTIGHPLETVTGYGPMLHGEAVAFGMVAESRVAAARGLLPPALLDELVELLDGCGLPTCAADLPLDVAAGDVIAAMEKVRLIRAGSLRYVLPAGIGDTVIADDVSEEETRRALAACGAR
jgi:3-dehydroquinate synthase